MIESTVTFLVPKRFVADTDMEMHDKIVLPWVEGKNLKLYYRDTRFDAHLQTKALRHYVRRQGTREHVRTTYVPQPGEVFVFTPAGRAMS